MIFIKLATRDAPQVTRVKYPTCWKHLLANTSGRKLPHVTQNFATIECVACPNGVVLHRVDGTLRIVVHPQLYKEMLVLFVTITSLLAEL